MRKNWRNNIVWILVLLLPLGFTACGKKSAEHEHAAGTQYTCPMHPQIVRDAPGDCPVCGMHLVPKQPAAAATPTATAAGNAPVAGDLNYSLQPANQTVISRVKTTQPVQKQVQQEITMSGIVTYDTRRQYIIPARFGGRIEKLYVQFNYQPVRKGQKLYDIYSPELVTAQKELLYLLQHDPSNTDLIKGAKQKLRLLGATDGQINNIIRTGKETYTFSVYSPYTGYVLDPAVTAAPAAPPTPAASASGDGMGGMGASSGSGGGMGSGSNPVASAPGDGFAIREGMYVTTGQALLKVIDASQVWAQFNLPSDQAGHLRKGTPVTITFNQLPGQTVQSEVRLVEPVYGAGANFAQVRASLPTQKSFIQVGQVITGQASYRTGTSLWVPADAVLDMGTQSVAFLSLNGVFQPISVQAGQRTGGQVEILSGLKAADVIAGNAQFLVDSESFIRVKENSR